MSFHHPIALLALAFVPLAIVLFAYAAMRRRQALDAFGSRWQGVEMEDVARARRWRGAVVVAVFGAMAIALAGPRVDGEVREISQEGIDLVIALDVSRSMLAEDVAPSRLERARFEVEQVLDQLSGSRIGIVLFAGEAFLQSPLTTDMRTVRRFLAAAGPELLPTQGTDIGRAIELATGAFEVGTGGAEENDGRARAILLLSDGEDHPGRIEAAVRLAEAEAITIFAVGIGHSQGAPIPLRREGSPGAFHTDRQGATVITRLEEEALRRVGRSGGYIAITPSRGSLAELPGQLARLDRTVLQTERITTFSERFQWPLGLAIVLLMAETLIVPRRRQPVLT